MGQGNYSAVIWGVITEQDLRDHPTVEAWGLKNIPLRTNYEGDDNWIGFMVADTDGNINTGYVPSDPVNPYPQRGLLLHLKAVPLSKLESVIAAADPQYWNEIKSAWDLFSQLMLYQTNKSCALIQLPPPELIFVNDWH